MNKWGVPQFSSFNVDLVGKAWKTVENSIDKAIGIPSEAVPQTTVEDLSSADSPSATPSPSAATFATDVPSTRSAPNTPSIIKPTSSASSPSRADRSTQATSVGKGKLASSEGSTCAGLPLEELLNGSTSFPPNTKEGPKITSKHATNDTPDESEPTINSAELPGMAIASADHTANNAVESTHLHTNTSKIPESITDIATEDQIHPLPLAASVPSIPDDSMASRAPITIADESQSIDPSPYGDHSHSLHSGDEDISTLHSLPDLSHDATSHDHDSSSSVTRSSSSSSLVELGSDLTSDLELKSKIIELNAKIAAIAIIEKEKDRQLEEKSKQLAIREKQLESAMERQATLSTEVQNLTEEVDKIRQKPPSSLSSSSSTNELVESLKEEFSRRLGATEKKLQAVTKERDELKKAQSMGDQAKGSVKAKDDEINTLRAEGTNLSLKILNLESTLKKYRATKKEDDMSLASLKEKINQAETLLEKRNDRIKQLEFSDKKYLETITTMKDVSDNAVRKLEKKELDLIHAQKQIQELQTNLDKATKDLLGAKKTTQEAGDKYLTEVEEAKRSVAQEYQVLSNKQAAEYQALLTQREATIAELRISLSSVTDQAGKKEDSLLRENRQLCERLDAAEMRNEEILQSIPNSTRPLLRQIEALQTLLDNKTRTADSMEKDLRARLADEDARCTVALEKERATSSALSELTHKVTLLENQYEEEHGLVTVLRTEVETLKLDEKKYKRLAAELNAKLVAAELQENQLSMELRQSDERYQRTISAMKELEEILTKSRDKEKEAREELNKLHRFGPSPNGSYNMRRSSSTNQDLAIIDQHGSSPHINSSPLGTSNPNSMSGSVMVSNLAFRDTANSLPIVERLQAMLSQRDGEIVVQQSQLSSLEAVRRELQEELTTITAKNEILTNTAAEFQNAHTELTELRAKFNTALQLVGEKEEQVMELKMDIQDLKEMYRTQISELIEHNERLQKRK